jgi:hypothetical protein
MAPKQPTLERMRSGYESEQRLQRGPPPFFVTYIFGDNGATLFDDHGHVGDAKRQDYLPGDASGCLTTASGYSGG